MKRIIIILSALFSISTYGREKAASQRNASGSNFSQKIMAECAAPKAAQELWVNNVRTIIYSGGDINLVDKLFTSTKKNHCVTFEGLVTVLHKTSTACQAAIVHLIFNP